MSNGTLSRLCSPICESTNGKREKTKGVKRQIVTDDIGCLLSVVVHKANLHDTKTGWWIAGLATFAYPTLKKICGEGGYRGSFIYESHKYFDLQVEISKKLKPQTVSSRLCK